MQRKFYRASTIEIEPQDHPMETLSPKRSIVESQIIGDRGNGLFTFLYS